MSEKLELRDEERQRCEVWTRVMGYHRPVSAFNPGKQSEHAERVHYLEERCRSGLQRVSQKPHREVVQNSSVGAASAANGGPCGL